MYWNTKRLTDGLIYLLAWAGLNSLTFFLVGISFTALMGKPDIGWLWQTDFSEILFYWLYFFSLYLYVLFWFVLAPKSWGGILVYLLANMYLKPIFWIGSSFELLCACRSSLTPILPFGDYYDALTFNESTGLLVAFSSLVFQTALLAGSLRLSRLQIASKS